MKTPDENPLLQDVLADEPLDALRRTSLDHALAAQGRARQFRRVRQVGMVAVLPTVLLAGWALLGHRPAPVPAAPMTVALKVPPASSGVQMISDEELFALFPHRALALIGRPGRQQLVSLGKMK
ncbi:MAG TPA: hypothetical protein VMB21_14805 [Candidatus Limnocylindria bacterium]|jgi:hypothetical protein|nr:hypothetical protein [Candidatus Limnocylindria bacterium]